MRSVTTKKEDRKQGRGEGTDVCKETEKRFVRRLQRTRETRQKKKGPVEKKKSCITTFLSFFFKKKKKKVTWPCKLSGRVARREDSVQK